MKVKLCGGSNDGRILTVLHGSSVKVASREICNGWDVNGEVIPSTRVTETYTRPAEPLMSNGAEHWVFAG